MLFSSLVFKLLWFGQQWDLWKRKARLAYQIIILVLTTGSMSLPLLLIRDQFALSACSGKCFGTFFFSFDCVVFCLPSTCDFFNFFLMYLFVTDVYSELRLIYNVAAEKWRWFTETCFQDLGCISWDTFVV